MANQNHKMCIYSLRNRNKFSMNDLFQRHLGMNSEREKLAVSLFKRFSTSILAHENVFLNNKTRKKVS